MEENPEALNAAIGAVLSRATQYAKGLKAKWVPLQFREEYVLNFVASTVAPDQEGPDEGLYEQTME